MALLHILRYPDARLHKVAAPVTVFDDALRALVRDMWETMYHADGIGLAAPQIGVAKRIMVVDLRRADEEDEEPPRVALVNPIIVWSSDETYRQSEGCLSIPGLEEVVERPFAIRVEARDVHGNEVLVEAEDLFGRALQHEIDHLDGILFLDRLSPLKRRMLLKKWRKSRWATMGTVKEVLAGPATTPRF